MVYVAVMGHGVVGSGVVEVLDKNRMSITRKAGQELTLRHILDIRDFPGNPHAELFTKSFDDIINDPKVSIVAEVMGGVHPAYEYVKSCLEAGKSVVTSNKELVAAKGAELLECAAKSNVNFLFEASVGGGIPIIRPLHQCLAANEIDEIAGILNGTTNFMLTKMIETGMSFDDALALAQQLGYAERDPSADVDGHDACRKICILASLAFGKHLYPNQVYTEGIRQLTPTDVKYASAIGRVIKLIGRACKREDGRLYAVVAPMLLPKDNLLAEVNDVFNGIMVRGDAIGDVVFYGRGAGKEPTASAVVADVIDEVKHLSARKYLFWEPGEEGYAIPHDDAESAMLVRVAAGDKQAVTAVFGQVAFIAGDRLPGDELAFVTPVLNEKELNGKLAALPVVSKWRLY